MGRPKTINHPPPFCKDCSKECLSSSKRRRWGGRCASCTTKYRGKTQHKVVPDMSGQKFGFLTVIKEDCRKNGSVKWWCQCECGKINSVTGNALRMGTSKSCGCYQRKRASETFSLKDGESYFTSRWNYYKAGAAARGLEWNLTKEEVRVLFSLDCHYCGISPQCFQKWRGGKEYKGGVKFGGIDRINSKLGYHYENCVPCCSICNRGKGKLEYDEFIAWMDKLIKHRIEYAAELSQLKII